SAADFPKPLIDRPAIRWRASEIAKCSAACLIGREGGNVVIARPAFQLAPLHGFELAVRQRKRLRTRVRRQGCSNEAASCKHCSEKDLSATCSSAMARVLIAAGPLPVGLQARRHVESS